MREPVPYLVFEDTVVRLERTIKRLWILCIIIFASFVISNCAWIYYESQWQVIESTTTIDAEQGDGVNIVSGGDVNYGTESQGN